MLSFVKGLYIISFGSNFISFNVKCVVDIGFLFCLSPNSFGGNASENIFIFFFFELDIFLNKIKYFYLKFSLFFLFF